MDPDRFNKYIELDHEQQRIDRLAWLWAKIPTSLEHADYIQWKAAKERSLATTPTYPDGTMSLYAAADARRAPSRLTDFSIDEIVEELTQRMTSKVWPLDAHIRLGIDCAPCSDRNSSSNSQLDVKRQGWVRSRLRL